VILARLLLFLLLAPLAACATAGPAELPAKRIALTFDDAPIRDGPLFSGAERASRLIAALKEAGVEQAAFFVTTGHLRAPADEERIRAYAAAGHLLANHSHGHRRLRRIGAEAYLADLDEASRALARFGPVRPWFRYPFLDEGHDAPTRDAVRAGLRERGLANAYVTVDTWDWALVDLVRKAKEAGKEIDLDSLRALYLETMLSAVDTYDSLARETLGRSPAHVLLAHENDVQALFVGDLVRELRQRGWTIVSPDEAFADPIAAEAPETLHNGNGRVAALAAVRGMDRARLADRYHDEALLLRLFDERVVKR
jgi:peptidoglycan/xylan/chitin deacetylase (PgdA/CDA1 family)